MIKEKEIKTRIINRLEKFPKNKLEDILRYIDQLDNGNSNKKNILSLAGSWSDIDDDLFNDLTKNLIGRRKSNSIARKR